MRHEENAIAALAVAIPAIVPTQLTLARAPDPAALDKVDSIG